jgi:hypothetical protein
MPDRHDDRALFATMRVIYRVCAELSAFLDKKMQHVRTSALKGLCFPDGRLRGRQGGTDPRWPRLHARKSTSEIQRMVFRGQIKKREATIYSGRQAISEQELFASHEARPL